MSDEGQQPDEVDEPEGRVGAKPEANADPVEKSRDVRAGILERRKLFMAAAVAGFSAAGACETSRPQACLSMTADGGEGGEGAQVCLSMDPVSTGQGAQGGQGGTNQGGAGGTKQGGAGGTNQGGAGGAGGANQSGGAPQVCLVPPPSPSPPPRNLPGRKGKG